MFGKKKSLDSGPSLRDASGAHSFCPRCGERLIGYGDTGGYCVKCGDWSFDNKLIHSRFKLYGKACETLCVLAAYDDVRMSGHTFYHIFGTLFITPFSLLFRPESNAAAMKRDGGELRRSPKMTGVALQTPYNEIASCHTFQGRDPTLGISYKPDPGYFAASCSYELQGKSYDGAEGEDMRRVKQLIDKVRGLCDS